MVLDFDLNYPPPGQDQISLEAKYGEKFMEFAGEADHCHARNQMVIELPIHQIGNERFLSVDDIERLYSPSAKRMRLDAMTRVARSTHAENGVEMVHDFNLNNPPPGHDIFSLEAKYGVDPLQLIRDVDGNYTRNHVVIDLQIQQIGNGRVASGDYIARSASPSAKKIKFNAIKSAVRARDTHDEFEYLLLDELPKEGSESDEEPQAPTFKCSICSNTIDQETSTKCGHIFCKDCILATIDAQGKCPTCKRKLKRKDTFRVYLPNPSSE